MDDRMVYDHGTHLGRHDHLENYLPLPQDESLDYTLEIEPLKWIEISFELKVV